MRRWLVLVAMLILLTACVMPAREGPPADESARRRAESAGARSTSATAGSCFWSAKGRQPDRHSGVGHPRLFGVLGHIQPTAPAIGPDVFDGVAEHTKVAVTTDREP